MTMVPSKLPIAFSGAPGAYSEEAALRFFGSKALTLTCRSSSDALEAVSSGRAHQAVVPVENTVTGFFDGIVEALSDYSDLGVAGEVELPIRHCLIGVPGARLEDIALVTSHQERVVAVQGLAERCRREYATRRRYRSSGPRVAESRSQGMAVLGSRNLADRYGLSILAEGLSDRPDNRTRFYVIGPKAEIGDANPGTGGTRTAVLLGPVSEPRVLKTLRIQLESLGRDADSLAVSRFARWSSLPCRV